MPKARDPLDDSIQDLTDNVVAIRHFTDREDAIEAFQTCVDADEGETLPVVSYYGVGGAGKSLLLRKLAGVLGESYKDMPFARVDFVAQANRDRVMALCSLRQQLGEFGLDFEGFDLVRAVMAWQQGASEEHLLAVSPWLKGALGMVKAVFAATQPLVAGAAAVAGAGAKPVADRVPQKTLDRVKAALGGTQALLDMRGLDPQTIFDRHLVPQFAAGLCEGLQKRKKGHRGVLFIDSYELLWSGSDTPRSPRGRDLDEWVRRLCSYLLHYRNVLLVIAGRDELAWPEIDPEWANATDDDIAGHAVGGLSRHDAASFLAKCEVGSPPDVGKAEPLQTAIVDCAEADPEVEGCHPFLLALCANIVQQERSGGGSDPAPSVFQDIPAGEAVERLAALFLKSLHSEETADLVQALSVPRWFDLELVTARRDAGEDTGRTLLTQLARFSFTQFGESGELRMHSVMRRALRLRLQQATPEHHVSVHEWCRDHWEGRIEADGGSAGREWWHHVSLTDPLGEKWNEVEQVLAEHSDQLGWEDAMTLPPTWLGCNVERLVRALMDGGLFVLAGRCVQHGTDIGDELEEELVSALFGEFGDSWRTWSIDVLVEMGSIRVMEAAMCMLGQGEPAPLFLADLVSAALLGCAPSLFVKAFAKLGKEVPDAWAAALDDVSADMFELRSGEPLLKWLAMQISKMALAERDGERFDGVFGKSLSTTAISARSALILEELGAPGVRDTLQEIVADPDGSMVGRLLSWCVMVGTTDGHDAAWLAVALEEPTTHTAPFTYAMGLHMLQAKHIGRLSATERQALSEAVSAAESVARSAVAELWDEEEGTKD